MGYSVQIAPEDDLTVCDVEDESTAFVVDPSLNPLVRCSDAKAGVNGRNAPAQVKFGLDEPSTPEIPLPPSPPALQVQQGPNKSQALVVISHVFVFILGLVLLWLSWPLKLVLTTYRNLQTGAIMDLAVYIVVYFLVAEPLVLLPWTSWDLLTGDYEAVLQGSQDMDFRLVGWLLPKVPWPKGSNSKIAALGRCRRPACVAAATGMVPVESTRAYSLRSINVTVHGSASKWDISANKSKQALQSSAASPSGQDEKEIGSLAPRSDTLKKGEVLAQMRTASLSMWRAVDSQKGGVGKDRDILVAVKKQFDKGADLNFPNAQGKTLLMRTAEHAHISTLRYLLENNANPNMQCADVDIDDCGNTALHEALKLSGRRVSSDEAYQATIEALLEDPRTDVCMYNAQGETPYMMASTPLQRQQLQPKVVTWKAICMALKSNVDMDSVANALASLVPAGMQQHCLRLPDLLFCEQEGSKKELRSRRTMIWNLFLKPMMEVCTARSLSKDEKSVLMYVWDATTGPPWSPQHVHNAAISKIRHAARADYAMDMQTTLQKVMKTFEKQLMPTKEALLADPYGITLCAKPANDQRVPDKDMQHGRFHPVPVWALQKNLSAAAKELQMVGALDSADEFCDLLQQGWHQSFDKPQKAYFADPTSLHFWMGLVTLWMLALHGQIAPAFESTMKAFAKDSDDGESEFHNGGMKKFPRIMVKAQEYIKEKQLIGWEQEVLSPLWVVDVLRCTFHVATAERALQVEDALMAALPLVRSKNGFHPAAKTLGGYADRKFNLLFDEHTHIGRVSLFVEVQLLLSSYVAAKQRMHGCYRVARGDFCDFDMGLQEVAYTKRRYSYDGLPVLSTVVDARSGERYIM